MYQLVIIGASPEGLAAAHSCVEQYPAARIALVTHGWERGWSGDRDGELAEEKFWEQLRLLAAQAVDMVVGEGTFLQAPAGLLYQTKERTLEGESYLLTSGKVDEENFNRFSDTPQQWAIVGALPENLVLAQELTKLSHRVTILSRNSQLLPGEDREMAALLQTYLASLGIEFWFNCSNFIRHYDQGNCTYRLQFNHGYEGASHHLTVDNFHSKERSPQYRDLLANLPELNPNGSQGQGSYLMVNQNLQTAHGQIYACGNWLKGYRCAPMAQQEAKYVVHQLLGKNTTPINYGQMPFTIDLSPLWYRIGNPAAPQKIVRGFEPYSDHCDLRGMYKLALDSHDRIISAHWFGPRARESMALLQLAIAKGISWSELKPLPLWENCQTLY
ncbi:NAD(P)/FAD-dependent oxidoreductase [Synechocystis sp. PCC 7339]|uniref:FAD-dependent oxidoreductase n=1 Tax=unclassified Synechocystis TaxID=2640012 RepID=UPI001BAF9DCE|nr:MULTISPECIES: FAD-dependent oxidoreductase [unclassified Synechocystis]QUS60227.1 NAD(P)/FAD-dependent oxidoreductase [Synechocystis sp. PCC 7338]UAJ72328.1 NAD(P)/FAD-dependent oxidoreductase [Synechocystis sp. PCC 7339]